MKQKALKECEYYTSRYAECASGRTLSVVWQCRKQARDLNEAVVSLSILQSCLQAYVLLGFRNPWLVIL
ncbi:hypothetical protein FRX31_021442 [Thalictrum thalictroides]|uniref:COX assembly mitochondrial protein n=1 Tax=Thalictrum thalictroides TaxID=46969 RepID=A0A7J6VV47_THATH|nr:hypothetical protein FRX31_021442 [Thalictrum thalictroides]